MQSVVPSSKKIENFEASNDMKSKSEKLKEFLDPELYFVDQQLIQSVLEHYSEVIRILEKTQTSRDEYKKQVDSLRQEINKLRHDILNENDDTKNRVIPLLESLRRNFINQMMIDKKEQENTQAEIIALKKERYILEENAVWCLSKITILEDQVGYYKKLKMEEEMERRRLFSLNQVTKS